MPFALAQEEDHGFQVHLLGHCAVVSKLGRGAATKTQQRLRVRLLFTWNPSPLRPSKFSSDCLPSLHTSGAVRAVAEFGLQWDETLGVSSDPMGRTLILTNRLDEGHTELFGGAKGETVPETLQEVLSRVDDRAASVMQRETGVRTAGATCHAAIVVQTRRLERYARPTGHWPVGFMDTEDTPVSGDGASAAQRSSSSGALPQLQNPLTSWTEHLPPKLTTDRVSSLIETFKTNYPGELLDADTTPSIRLLSLVHKGLKPGQTLKWVPWQFRFSPRQCQERMEAKSQKCQSKTTCGGLACSHPNRVPQPWPCVRQHTCRISRPLTRRLPICA